MTIERLTDTIQKLELMTPISSFKFGHTPLQIEFFQTANQQGNEKWEYWQHILQLRALHTTLCELKIAHDDAVYEQEDANSLWPLWTRKKRRRSIPRIQLKLNTIQRSIDEKTREVDYHLEVIERRYKHLKALTEDDILSDETSYWATRLGRQLGASHLGRILGVSESELLAVLSLPLEQQRQVFEGMRQLLGAATPLLPLNKKEG
jgi:hypothetical protein